MVPHTAAAAAVVAAAAAVLSPDVQPFLALSADELSRTLPLLAEVPVETLKVALPLLAKQDISVVQKMLKFLKLVRIQAAPPCIQHTNLKRSDICAGLLYIEAAFSVNPRSPLYAQVTHQHAA
jgi:hypothetical protein